MESAGFDGMEDDVRRMEGNILASADGEISFAVARFMR